MTNMVPCPHCPDGFNGPTRTNTSVCRTCGGTGKVEARTGESREASFQPEPTASPVDGVIVPVERKPDWVARSAWIAEQMLERFPNDPELEPERADPNDPSKSLELPHLLFMAIELRNRAVDGETKACRWLGWLQAGSVGLRLVTLEDMKRLNLASGYATARPHSDIKLSS